MLSLPRPVQIVSLPAPAQNSSLPVASVAFIAALPAVLMLLKPTKRSLPAAAMPSKVSLPPAANRYWVAVLPMVLAKRMSPLPPPLRVVAPVPAQTVVAGGELN